VLRSANLPLLRLLRRHPGLLPRLAVNLARVRAGQPVLRAVEFAVTLECPARCPHCFVGDHREPASTPLTVGEVAVVIREACALGAVVIHFSGGEPLLRGDLEDLVAAVPRQRAVAALTTSAHRLDGARLAALGRAGLDVLVVSLEGDDAAAHDRFRGLVGGHRVAVAALRQARRAGLTTVINFMVTAARLADGTAERTADLARDLGAQLNVFLPSSLGRWADHPLERLGAPERVAYRRLLARRGVRWCGDSAYRGQGCRAGSEKLTVDVDGTVRACAVLPATSFGNVRDAPLADLWSRARAAAPASGLCPAAELQADHRAGRAEREPGA